LLLAMVGCIVVTKGNEISSSITRPTVPTALTTKL
jgi:hypothetical protein